MSLLKLYRILKERKKSIKSSIENQKTLTSIQNYHNKFIKKYPNLAVFAYDRIGTYLTVYGIYEKGILETLKDRIFNKIDTQNSVCLDVGANIGNHTLNFAQFFNKVYSFEPHPEIFELLKFNARKSKNVKVFQFGLSNRSDEMILKADYDISSSGASLRNKSDLKSGKDADAFNVQVKKFDDFFNNINEKNNISFVKLDVEDHELYALQGMKKTLEQNSPIICFEQHVHHFDYFGKELSSKSINFLKDNGYSCFYDIFYERKWRFSNNYYPNKNLVAKVFNFIKKIIRLFEAILFGMPEILNKIVRINEFSKRGYAAIIASKTPLE